MKLHIHAVQLDLAWENPEVNYQRASALLEEAHPHPGSLIILPEMFPTGFSKDVKVTSEPADGPTAKFFQSLATRWKCAVLGGYVQTTPTGAARNVAAVFAADGTLLAEYVKQQPFSLGGEHLVHEAGHETIIFEFGGFKIAPMICYDLRFPEVARRAAAQGAELFINIASWPIKRANHWTLLLQARAIENLAWVVGVNRCGTDPEFIYPGRSIVVDPHGNIIADAADREQVLHGVLDHEVLSTWRAQFPALHDAKWDHLR
ncbi:MAG: carbon-nitrogen family hydrolase [Verrucomicrobiaceae bacterium]|nr:carbon-nitrogen family hydrolase [Verrucomicrobiaceae bacterium]